MEPGTGAVGDGAQWALSEQEHSIGSPWGPPAAAHGDISPPRGSCPAAHGLCCACVWGAQQCACAGTGVCVRASARRSCVRVHRGAGVCAGLCARACMAVQARAAACACTHTSVCTRLRGGVSRGRSRGQAGTAAGPGALGLPQPRRAARDLPRPGAGAGKEHAGAAPLLPPGSPRSRPSQSRGSDPPRAGLGAPGAAAPRPAPCCPVPGGGGRSGAGDTRQRLYCGRSPRGASGEGPGWAGGFPHHPRLRPHGRGEGSAGAAAATLLSPGPQRRARRRGGCPGAGWRGRTGVWECH